MTMMDQQMKAKAQRLLELHAGSEVLVMANAWDCPSSYKLEQSTA